MSLDTCAIEARRGYLDLGGGVLSFLEWVGEGPPILLLHGITSSANTLWRAGPALAAGGRRVLALDMPGHGESDISPAHGIDTIAGLVSLMIGALGLREVTLVGHSWGGATALALAGGAEPGRAALARMILIDPLLGMSPAWGQRALPSYASGLGEPAATLIAPLRANNPTWHGCDVYWKADAMERCRYAQVAGLFNPAEEWSLLDRVSQVAVPTLILVADPQFTIIPPEALTMVAQRLPLASRIVVVPGTTHNMLRGPGYEPTMELIQAWIP